MTIKLNKESKPRELPPERFPFSDAARAYTTVILLVAIVMSFMFVFIYWLSQPSDEAKLIIRDIQNNPSAWTSKVERTDGYDEFSNADRSIVVIGQRDSPDTAVVLFNDQGVSIKAFDYWRNNSEIYKAILVNVAGTDRDTIRKNVLGKLEVKE